jgi:EAL domain-containing protein (putative c-di-GMP-specific phosphodiesterase class I)
MRATADTQGTLDAIRARGVRVAVDDFGTGYSSLSYLKRFPLDTLKVDQSFVRGVPDDGEDAAITRAIIHMAHSLGLQVVAEGVEEQRQLDFLREEGCDIAQGYLLGRPMPAVELALLLASEARR